MINPDHLSTILSTRDVTLDYDEWMKKRHPFVEKKERFKKKYYMFFFDFLSADRYKMWKKHFKNGNSDFFNFVFENINNLPMRMMINSVVMGADVKRGLWLNFEKAHENIDTLLQVIEFVSLPEDFIGMYDQLQPQLWDFSEVSKRFLKVLFKFQKIPYSVIVRYSSKIKENDQIRNALVTSDYRHFYETNYTSIFKNFI